MAELMTIVTTPGSTACYAIRLHYASRCATCRVAGGEKATGSNMTFLLALWLLKCWSEELDLQLEDL